MDQTLLLTSVRSIEFVLYDYFYCIQFSYIVCIALIS